MAPCSFSSSQGTRYRREDAKDDDDEGEENEDQSDEPAVVCVAFSGSAMLTTPLGLLACTMASPRCRQQETECSPQFLEPTCAISLQRERAPYVLPRRHVLGVTASLVIAALSPAIAQEQSHAAKGRETSLISAVRTGKERLGRKWMDEQRIDNRKVPIDKRGTKPRLDTC